MTRLTLLVNPLRHPLTANLFSVKYYKKYVCILQQVRSPKRGNMVGRHGWKLLAQWMALRGEVILAIRDHLLVLPGGTP
jgi:hypothetical protein